MGRGTFVRYSYTFGGQSHKNEEALNGVHTGATRWIRLNHQKRWQCRILLYITVPTYFIMLKLY